MVEWAFWRRRGRRRPAPTLPSRTDPSAITRLDLHEFMGSPEKFYGRAVWIEQVMFEAVAHAIVEAPTAAGRLALMPAAAAAAAKQQFFAQRIDRPEDDEVLAVVPADIDRLRDVVTGGDWYESVLACYLTSGFLDDLLLALSHGLPDGPAGDVQTALADHSADATYLEILLGAMHEQPRLAARLAMWGRRVLGDTLLSARDSLSFDEVLGSRSDEVEPAFAELVGTHTRRMDALGLTA